MGVPELVGTPTQLTQYTDDSGAVSGTQDSTHIFDPYLRAVAALPVGADRGKTSIVGVYTAGNGWMYDNTTCMVSDNRPGSARDSRGIACNRY